MLLIIPDSHLRQLYHEKLFSSELEIVPVEDLACALLLLTLMHFTVAVLHIEIAEEAEVFLRLRSQNERFATVKLIVLSNNDYFDTIIKKNDMLLSPLKFSFKEIVSRIKKYI